MLLLLACVHAPPVIPEAVPRAPEPTVRNSRVEFYDVYGDDPVDVVIGLAKAGPMIGNVHHAARTTWSLEWRYPAGPGDGSAPACDLDYVDVKLELHTLFPRWISPPDARPEDVAEWYRYSSALAEHESSHVELIRDLAGQVPATLRAMGCVGAETNGRSLLGLIDEANRELDARTDNGASTGAKLAWLGGRP